MKKTRTKIFICIYSILLFSTVVAAQSTPNKNTESLDSETNATPTEVEYKVGQTWSYETRPNEKESTLIIVKIDNTPKYGKIIHIAVRDVKIRNRRSLDGFFMNVNHMPFAEKSIRKSVVKLLKKTEKLPDFKEGSNIWKTGFDEARAGFYTITVAEAIQAMEEIVNQ
mgnify:FL=1